MQPSAPEGSGTESVTDRESRAVFRYPASAAGRPNAAHGGHKPAGRMQSEAQTQRDGRSPWQVGSLPLPQTGHLRALSEAKNLGTHTGSVLCQHGRSVRLNIVPSSWDAPSVLKCGLVSVSFAFGNLRLFARRGTRGKRGSWFDPVSRRQAASTSRFQLRPTNGPRGCLRVPRGYVNLVI